MSNPQNGNPGDTAPGPDSLHQFSEALADVVARVAPGIVAIHARRRIPASGVVWRAGYVVASDHTIRRERDITVTLDDGRSVGATIVGRDASTDLALLKLADDAIPAVERAPAQSARPGQLVLAVGRPGTGVTATLGTVHTVGGEWRTWQGGQLAEHIRSDIEVHDGFSGSALVDTQARVIGINSSILARGAPATIPAATVDRVVDQLLAGGHIPRGWLGVGTQPVRLPERVRTEASLAQEVGLLVVNVATGSPAERAGMFVGDTLLSLAGTPTREADDVLAILGPDTVGKTLTARLVRAGAVIELPVEIGSSPHARSHGGGPGGGPGFGGPPFGGHGFGGWGGFGRRGPGPRDGGPQAAPEHDHSHGHHGHEHARHHARHRAEWQEFRRTCAWPNAETIEQLRAMGQSFGFGFAHGFGPRRAH